MRDLSCDEVNFRASSFDVGKISVYYKIVIKNLNRKMWKSEHFYVNFRVKVDDLGVEFIACCQLLTQEGALISFI